MRLLVCAELKKDRNESKKLCKFIYLCCVWKFLGGGGRRKRENLHLRRFHCCPFQGRHRRVRKKLSTSRLRRCFRRTIQVVCNPERESFNQVNLPKRKTHFVNVSSFVVEQSECVSSRHESLFNVAQLQRIQRKHVLLFFLVFVLVPGDAFGCQDKPVRSWASWKLLKIELAKKSDKNFVFLMNF